MARFILALFSLLLIFPAGCGNLQGVSVTSTQTSPGPTGLSVVETTSSTIRLSWAPSQGAAAYRIYRGQQLIGTNVRPDLVTPPATTFTDTGLKPATTYSYTIVTVSAIGAEAGTSAPIFAATLAGSVTDGYPPEGLVVSQSTTTSITITWAAATTEDGASLTYKVYRNGSYVGSATIASGVAGSYTDTNLTPATTYSYTVTLASETAPSIQVTATTQGSAVSTQSAVSTFAGSASPRGGWSDAIGASAAFSTPYGITTDGTSLYVADAGSNTIRRIDIATRSVTTIAGSAGITGSADGVGSAATFSSPRGIATDGTSLFVADSANNTIRKINIATRAVTTLAGKAGSRGYANGAGTDARFYAPRGLATDGVNLYVADTYNNAIRKIDIASGVVSTLAGYPGAHGSNDGFGTGAAFYFPYGVATDGTNVYVTDTCNFTIRKISIASSEVTTIAGYAGYHGASDGTGINATFNYADGLASDGSHVYVADTTNNIIRVISLATGDVSTVAGLAGVHGVSDGSGTSARFFYPRGVSVAGRNLYITDTSNNTVRKISLDDLN